MYDISLHVYTSCKMRSPHPYPPQNVYRHAQADVSNLYRWTDTEDTRFHGFYENCVSSACQKHTTELVLNGRGSAIKKTDIFLNISGIVVINTTVPVVVLNTTVPVAILKSLYACLQRNESHHFWLKKQAFWLQWMSCELKGKLCQ